MTAIRNRDGQPVEVDPPYRRSITLGALAALLAAGALAIYELQTWFGSLRSLPPGAAMEAMQGGAAVLMLLVAVPGLLGGALLARTGAAACRQSRFPPRGAWLLRPTRVLRGTAARRRGAALRALGISVALFGTLAGGLLWWAIGELVQLAQGSTK